MPTLRSGVTVTLERPEGDPVCSVLVLSGSSGRVERARCRWFADRGAAAISLQWFGGIGQPAGICEVALETFVPALDELFAMHPRLAVLGASKGAEAALLLASFDPRIQLVAALAPTSVVWANVGPGVDGHERPQRSSWTRAGSALPFVPYDERWAPDDSARPAWRGLYETSLRRRPDLAVAAAIPVEDIQAAVVLTAGGDDRVWPSELFAHQIRSRRAAHHLATTVCVNGSAGHRVLLPGEAPPEADAEMARGGTEDADRALGSKLAGVLSELLGLTPGR
ncbi:MAG: uncharacterized protein QOJ48_1375 [Frankiales bacterium]|nr:uncharacterized protein [Frankiales bacterium]